eukprot:2138895-Pleurochrysis_carterae.AAC.1
MMQANMRDFKLLSSMCSAVQMTRAPVAIESHPSFPLSSFRLIFLGALPGISLVLLVLLVAGVVGASAGMVAVAGGATSSLKAAEEAPAAGVVEGALAG